MRSVGPNSKCLINGIRFNLTDYEASMETEAIDAGGTEDVATDAVTPVAPDTPGRVKARIRITANLDRGVSPLALTGFTGLDGQLLALIECYVDGLDFLPDVFNNVFVARYSKAAARMNQPNQITLEGTCTNFTIV